MAAAAVLMTGANCATGGPAKPANDPQYHVLPERQSLGLPYSDAVQAGNLLFLAGTIGAAPSTRRIVDGGVVSETRQALENIKQNLEIHGSSLEHVVKCTVFLADIGEFESMNGVYREYFPANKPARTTVAVKDLPLGARIEIECIAVVP